MAQNAQNPRKTLKTGTATDAKPSSVRPGQLSRTDPASEPSPTSSEGSPLKAPSVSSEVSAVLTSVRDWAKGKLVSPPSGFRNTDVKCYRNAVLVMLLNIPPFIGYFQTRLINVDPPAGVPFNFVRRFNNLAEAYHGLQAPKTNDRVEREMNRLWRCVFNAPAPFRCFPPTARRQQQDAHEFMELLLSNIALELDLDPNERAVFENIARTTFSNYHSCGGPCKPRKIRPPIKEEPDYFLAVQCRFDGETKRSLGPITLEDCIARSLSVPLEGYRCDTCKKARAQGTSASLKKTKFYKVPEVLFIRIVRFAQLPNGLSAKEYRKVIIPEYLDLAPYLETKAFPEKKGMQYRLVGAIMHQGALRRGHYINICRTGSGDWYEINDTAVQRSDFSKVNSHPANVSSDSIFLPYILAYTKVYDDKELEKEVPAPREQSSSLSTPKPPPVPPPCQEEALKEDQSAAGKKSSPLPTKKGHSSALPGPPATDRRSVEEDFDQVIATRLTQRKGQEIRIHAELEMAGKVVFKIDRIVSGIDLDQIDGVKLGTYLGDGQGKTWPLTQWIREYLTRNDNRSKTTVGQPPKAREERVSSKEEAGREKAASRKAAPAKSTAKRPRDDGEGNKAREVKKRKVEESGGTSRSLRSRQR